MRSRLVVAAVGVISLGALVAGQAPKKHLNPLVDLFAQKKPVFGLYAPANRGGGPGRQGGGNPGGGPPPASAAGGATAVPPAVTAMSPNTPPAPPAPKTPAGLARTLA